MRTNKFDNALRRVVAMAFTVGIATTLVPLPGQVAMAADSIDTLLTSYQPVISESIDTNGFKHPGVGFTKEQLETCGPRSWRRRNPGARTSP